MQFMKNHHGDVVFISIKQIFWVPNANSGEVVKTKEVNKTGGLWFKLCQCSA